MITTFSWVTFRVWYENETFRLLIYFTSKNTIKRNINWRIFDIFNQFFGTLKCCFFNIFILQGGSVMVLTVSLNNTPSTVIFVEESSSNNLFYGILLTFSSFSVTRLCSFYSNFCYIFWYTSWIRHKTWQNMNPIKFFINSIKS